MSFLSIIASILSFIIGYLALTSGLCMVRGVVRALKKRPGFLLAILFSGSFTWIILLIAYLFSYEPPSIPIQVTLLSVFGGFLFGLGSAINHGCGISTISRLARGEIFIMMTICGWLIGWIFFAKLIPDIPEKQHLNNNFVRIIFLAIISAFVFLGLQRSNRTNRRTWGTILSIGFIAGIVFMIESDWAPSQFLRDTSLSLLHHDKTLFPSLGRIAIMICLVLGMVIGAMRTHAFSLRFGTKWLYLKHLFAGILMGLGGVLASGGNDLHLLLGLPSFSIASIVVIICMITGIATGIQLSAFFSKDTKQHTEEST